MSQKIGKIDLLNIPCWARQEIVQIKISKERSKKKVRQLEKDVEN